MVAILSPNTCSKIWKLDDHRLSNYRYRKCFEHVKAIMPKAVSIPRPSAGIYPTVQPIQIENDAFLLCEELKHQGLRQNELRVDFERLLGTGGFGSVYLGSFMSREVAIKVMDKQPTNRAALDESYRAELRVMSLNHKNIVKTLAATSPNRYEELGAMIIMQYIPGRNLQDVINDRGEILSPGRRVKWALQFSNALDYAHNNCIVHLDFKPANVMITLDDNCKLGDFGCCQKVESETGAVSPTERSVLTGTVAYRAPEVLKGEAPTLKSDIYSVGITLWQMLSRETPHGNEKHPHVIVFGVVAYNLRPKLIDVQEDPFELCYTDLYTECWMASPRDRPGTLELIELLEIWQRYI